MSTNELYRRTATDVVGLLKRGEVTPLELIDVAAAPAYPNSAPRDLSAATTPLLLALSMISRSLLPAKDR